MKLQTSPALDSSSVAMRLGICAAALASTAGVMSDAQAAIVTFNVPIPVPNNTDGIYINFLNGVSSTPASNPGWDFNPYNQTTFLTFFWPTAAGTGGVATTTLGPYLDLPVGTVVSSGSTFSKSVAQTAGTPFLTAGTHILGFSFFNETTSALNYGYLRMTNGGTTGFPATITSWSFENTGAAITVAPAVAVPEASTAAMLSLGALALGALNLRKLRRQRRQLAA
jgi:hypothetical protein